MTTYHCTHPDSLLKEQYEDKKSGTVPHMLVDVYFLSPSLPMSTL